MAVNLKWDTEKYPGMKDFKKFWTICLYSEVKKRVVREIRGACLSPQNAF